MSSSTSAIIVIGAGGHAGVLVDSLKAAGVTPNGITDPDPPRPGADEFHGISYFGDDSELKHYPPEEVSLVNGVSSPNSPEEHRSIYCKFKEKGYGFHDVIHPESVCSKNVDKGEGVQILASATVQTGVTLGNNLIVNTGASVDHDCQIGHHCHIAPGAVLSGDVKVENNVHIGTGAAIIQGIRIGQGAMVGAGAVVTEDVAPDTIVVGNPAEVLES